MSRTDVMKILALVAVCGVSLSCGQKNETTFIPADPPAKGPAPTAPVFANIKPILAKACIPCHSQHPGTPTFETAEAFRRTQAKGELLSGSMPQAPVTISAADKAALLSFLGS